MPVHGRGVRAQRREQDLQPGRASGLGARLGGQHQRFGGAAGCFQGGAEARAVGRRPQGEEVRPTEIAVVQLGHQAADQAHQLLAGRGAAQDEDLRQQLGEIARIDGGARRAQPITFSLTPIVYQQFRI